MYDSLLSSAHTDSLISDDLFKINAGIVRELATGIATTCPKAFILVISNPVNSTVPIVAEVLKQHNVFDPKRYVYR
jgi:malate dehydrogenase